MKSFSPLLCGLVLLSTMPSAWAEAPALASPPSVSSPVTKPLDKPAPPEAKKDKDAKPAPTPPPAPAPVANTPKLDDYMVELSAAVNLSDAEKKEIHDIYTDDGASLQNILNDGSLSPLQKAGKVSDLRDARNEKIESLLHNLDRQKAFYAVETVYRVSLTESAADGGLLPPAPAKPAPAPATPAPAANAAPPATSPAK